MDLDPLWKEVLFGTSFWTLFLEVQMVSEPSQVGVMWVRCQIIPCIVRYDPWYIHPVPSIYTLCTTLKWLDASL